MDDALDVLPDIIQPDLPLLVCGLNAGPTSAKKGHYFANPGHRFWTTLHDTGITSSILAATDDAGLPAYGVGLSDLCKGSMHGDGHRPDEQDRERLKRTIVRFQPRIVAFLGQFPARSFLDAKQVPWGVLTDRVGPSKLAVVPDPSPANGHFNRLKHHWIEVASAAGLPHPGNGDRGYPS